MQKLINRLSLGLLVLTLLPALVQAAINQEALTIQHWQTKNKVGVYFVERPQIPMLDVSLVLHAGSAYDGKQFGLAALTESLIGEGTQTRTATQIATDFDSVGAQFSSSINRDMVVLSLRTLTAKKYFANAIETALEVMTQASFSPKAFQRVQHQTLDAIRQGNQDPSTVAFNRFYQTVYHNLPYGHSVKGTLASVSKLTRSDVLHFYKTYYVRENVKIILVGALSKHAAHALAEKISAALPSGQKAQSLDVVRDKAISGKALFVPMPVAQNTIILGENGIRRQDKGYFDLIVANHVLGGMSMTSLLFENVRNQQGLVYGISSGFSPLAARGPFFIWLQTRSAQSANAISLVKSVVDKFIQQGPSAQQLKAAQANLVGAFPLLLSTNSGILANVINIAFYELPLDYFKQYTYHILQVTPLSAKVAFANKVSLSSLNTIVVGSKGSTPDAKPS